MRLCAACVQTSLLRHEGMFVVCSPQPQGLGNMRKTNFVVCSTTCNGNKGFLLKCVANWYKWGNVCFNIQTNDAKVSSGIHNVQSRHFYVFCYGYSGISGIATIYHIATRVHCSKIQNMSQEKPSWIAVENTQPFTLIVFQVLLVWEIIAGMLSCTRQEKCRVAKRQNILQPKLF